MKFVIFKQKMRELRIEDLYDGNFYHICTDGTDCPTIMSDEEDFRTAKNYLALTSWQLAIPIIAYCIMSNHVHVLVASKDRKKAVIFIRKFKQLYSTYLQNKYHMKEALKKINESISIINDLNYLRRCIAYILRNPVNAKVCKRLEDYSWSSYPCYFCSDYVTETGRTLSKIPERQKRSVLRTRMNLKDCQMTINSYGIIQDQSFIRADLVEKVFMNSGRVYLSHLGHGNDSQMEYELVCKPLMKTNDIDIVSASRKLAEQWFNNREISSLTTSEKCRMIKTLFFNNKTSIAQISRVLGLPRDLVRLTISR